MRSVALTIGSGALYALLFPPYGLSALAWCALTPWLLRLLRAGDVGAAGLAWLWTMTWCAGVIDWLPSAMARYYAQPLTVGLGVFVVVSTAMGAVEYAAFALYYRRLRGMSPALRPLATAAGWVAAELARGKLLTGNPWALLGYSQVSVLPLVQVADVAGIYGVSFVLAMSNAALVEVWLARRASAAVRGRAWGSVALVALLVAGVATYGSWRMRRAAGPAVGNAGVRVVIVQSHQEVSTQWHRERQDEDFAALLSQTAVAIRAHRPEVVFWPESALTFFLEDAGMQRASLRSVLAPGRVQLVTGGPRHAPDGNAFNAAFLLQPDGVTAGWQDKRYLIPFAEYFPFARRRLVHRDFGAVPEFVAGDLRPPLPTVAGPAGVLICNESLFPEAARELVDAGAGVLIHLANDTWHGGEGYSAEALEVARVRAIEQRRWLVRVSTSGPSAIVDPAGVVRARTEPGERTSLAGELPREPQGASTVYARAGDAFAWMCAMAALLVIVRRRATVAG